MRKLIRDNIVNIMENSEQPANYYIAKDAEYYSALKNKLKEELDEFLESDEPSELYDLQEVIDAILDFKSIPIERRKKDRRDKANKKGKFQKRHILIMKDNSNEKRNPNDKF